MASFGRRVTELRKEKGLTQAALAEAVGVSKNTVSVWERDVRKGILHVETLGNEYTWFDAGTADSLYVAAGTIRTAQRSGKLIGCPEEQALKNRWITVDQLRVSADQMSKTNYGEYLFGLIDDIENED